MIEAGYTEYFHYDLGDGLRGLLMVISRDKDILDVLYFGKWPSRRTFLEVQHRCDWDLVSLSRERVKFEFVPQKIRGKQEEKRDEGINRV